MPDFYAEIRKENFKNIVHKTPFLDFSKCTEKDEHPTIGIQCQGRIQSPSWPFGYPDQTYWSMFYFIILFGRKKFIIDIRQKKMPYRNFSEFIIWYKAKQKSKLQTAY